MSTRDAQAAAPKPQRRLRAPVRRELILQEAISVFAERGYAVSLDEVAERCDIARSVLYYYFPSKKDLFAAVVEAQQAEIIRHLAPIILSTGPMESRVRAVVEAFLDFVERYPRSWRILFGDFENADPELAEVSASAHETAIRAASALMVNDTATLGVDLATPRGRVMAEVVLGGMAQTWRWWSAHPEIPRAEVADGLYESLWLGFAGRLARSDDGPG